MSVTWPARDGGADAPARPEDPTATLFCIPVFNDWGAVSLVLERLAAAARALEGPAAVLLVDDGSTEPLPPLPAATLEGFASVEVLRLRRNLGHQRAITLGLAFIHRHRPCGVVVVMDGDGQDDPGDVALLLEQCRRGNFGRIVFARRTRRSERPLFQAGYHSFRLVHRLLTGLPVEVGNFSAVPFAFLDRLVGISEMWNHYAAAVIHARLPIDKVPIPRRRRLGGEGKMDATALVLHGMSAISVYGAVIGVRLLWFTGALCLLAAGGGLAAAGARLLTPLPLPGWALPAGAVLGALLLNLLVLSTLFVIFVLQWRNASNFLPIRDWPHYVSGVEGIHAAPGGD